MSAPTASPAPVRRSAVAGTARYLLRTYLRVIGWTLAVVVVGIGVAVVLIDRWGTIDVSLLSFGRQGLVWFPFSLMVIVASTYLGPHVAMGLTRRSLGHASLVVAAVTAVVLGGAVAVLIEVEGLAYGALGLEHGITQGLARFGAAGVPHLLVLVVDHSLLVLGGEVAGLVVGATYRRWHPFVATVALPLTVAPALLTSVLLESDQPTALDPTSPAGLLGRLVLVLAVLGVASAAYLRIQRGTAIAPAPA